MKKITITIIASFLIVAFMPTKTFALTTSKRWKGNECLEFTSNSSNNVIRSLDLDECRKSEGTSISWSGRNCVEFTPSYQVIRSLDLDECRKSEGTSISWSGHNCLEFTPSNEVIRKLNIDECKESDGAVKKRIKPGTAKPVSNADVPKQSDCEELVPDQYVICGGVKYVPDLKNNNGLKRDVKKIEDYSDKNIAAPAKSAVAK